MATHKELGALETPPPLTGLQKDPRAGRRRREKGTYKAEAERERGAKVRLGVCGRTVISAVSQEVATLETDCLSSLHRHRVCPSTRLEILSRPHRCFSRVCPKTLLLFNAFKL